MQKPEGKTPETRRVGWLTLPARLSAPLNRNVTDAADADAPLCDDRLVHGAQPQNTEQPSSQENLLLGRYRLEGEAGHGGFASVKVAWDTRIQRRVAIKCMPLEEAAEMLPEGGSILLGKGSIDTSAVPGLEEARTAAKLSDSSIVQVYDFEVQDGMAYLILEYVDGMTLAEVLHMYPDEVDPDIVSAVFKAVAKALQVAHAHQVLHLDIKPENVLIDKQGHVKVTDFGLARLAGEAGYGAAEGGTIGYMPPEQMEQRNLSERCDEWALASLAYEMISGANPFLANSISEAEDAIYDAELVIPSLCMEGLDPAIDDVMFCALSPDPDERYTSIKEFADQMQPCLGGPRKGANKLKRLVGDEFEETAEEEPEEFEPELPEKPREPWHPTPRMKSVFARIWAAASAAVLGFLTLNSVVAPDAWGNPISWGVLAAFALLSALLPSVGALFACEALGVSLCVFGSPVLGVAFMAAAACWWYFTARHSREAANVGLLPTLIGSFGFAPLAPFAAGYLLRPRDAAATTLFAGVLALTLSGLGSHVLSGWDAFSYALVPLAGSVQDLVAALLVLPSTWITLVAWVAAAAVSSALCGTGNRAFCTLGMILAGALEVGAIVAGSLADSAGTTLLANPLALVPVIAALVVAVVLTCTAAPSRAFAGEGE